MKHLSTIYFLLVLGWFLQANYYGKVWQSILPPMMRTHGAYTHK